MTRARPPVLVLGLTVTGYAAVRALSQAGLRVFAAYTDRGELGRHSRLCDSFAVSPDRMEAATQLAALCGRLGNPVLLPTSDWWALLLAEHHDTLAPVSAFHWMPGADVWRLADKAQVARVCEEAGVLAPRTFGVERTMSLDDIVRGAPLPCVIKALDSVGTGLPAGAKTILATSADELRDLFQANPELAGRVVCQELIEGGDESMVESIVCMTSTHAVAGIATMRKVRQYPPGFGVTSFGRVEELREVEVTTLKLLRHVGWKGIASLEFKQRPSDGRYYFIELNPRMPWYASLLTAAGINFPLLAYNDLTGAPEPRAAARVARPTAYWLHLELDVGNVLRSGRVGPRRLTQWIWSLRHVRSFAWLEARDPAPFLHALARWARLALSRFRLTRRHSKNE